MGCFEVLMIGAGLAMDAFAAAVCKGLCLRRVSVQNVLLIGICFGGFQAGMPLAGYLIGRRFEDAIVEVDHWAAFTLLGFIGLKMIYDSLGGGDLLEETGANYLNLREILVLALATSIDALAVGISFAFLKVEIVPAAGLIGMVTFFLSAAGVGIGRRFGDRYKEKATLAGGLILILIGCKILYEHMWGG